VATSGERGEAECRLRRIRLLVGIVITGLIVSGITAFPLLHEVALLDRLAHSFGLPAFFSHWAARVHEGLERTYAAYPFLGYGTDWLAFGHIVIAFFLVGAWIDPVRNVWLIRAAMIACVFVIPTALICGAFRGIPLWWRAIDSCFGVFGFVPLWMAARETRRLERDRAVSLRENNERLDT
jgi:hypothetical protein